MARGIKESGYAICAKRILVLEIMGYYNEQLYVQLAILTRR